MRFFRRNRRGANAIEFALTLPLFVTMTFGMMEFGWFFSRKALINSVIGKACREASLIDANNPPAALSGGCGGGGDGCVENQAEAVMIDLMAASGASCSTCSATVSGAVPNKRVTCTIDTPHEDITGFYNAFFPANIEAETSVRLEWQRVTF